MVMKAHKLKTQDSIYYIARVSPKSDGSQLGSGVGTYGVGSFQNAAPWSCLGDHRDATFSNWVH